LQFSCSAPEDFSPHTYRTSISKLNTTTHSAINGIKFFRSVVGWVSRGEPLPFGLSFRFTGEISQ
jgi:hypothetical protein